MAIKMNKVSQKSKRQLTFGDLKIGDICQGDDCSLWYMKTENRYDACGDLAGNAICLSNGEVVEFCKTENVSKLKKDLVIDYSDDDITEWYE